MPVPWRRVWKAWKWRKCADEHQDNFVCLVCRPMQGASLHGALFFRHQMYPLPLVLRSCCISWIQRWQQCFFLIMPHMPLRRNAECLPQIFHRHRHVARPPQCRFQLLQGLLLSDVAQLLGGLAQRLRGTWCQGREKPGELRHVTLVQCPLERPPAWPHGFDVLALPMSSMPLPSSTRQAQRKQKQKQRQCRDAAP